MGHDVFLSYSRKDKDTMQRVRDGLRNTGITVWTDENLKPGTPAWKTAIQEAIETANCLVVLLSPYSKNSKWVSREITYAQLHEIWIIPVLISDNVKESIPIDLDDHEYVSLVGTDIKQFVKELADAIPNVPVVPAPPPQEDQPEKRQPRPASPKASQPKKRQPPAASPEKIQPEEHQPPPAPALDLNRFSSTPLIKRPTQSPFGEGASNLRLGTTGRPVLYRDFLQRYQFNPAEWEERQKQERAKREKEQAEAEAKRKKELAEAAAQIEKIRANLPDAPTLRPWHPVDQLRLAWWLLMDPDKAYIFQYKTPLEVRVHAGAWLLSLTGYLPLLILALAAAFGWLPVENDLWGLPRVILPVAIVISWALTELFAASTDDTSLLFVFIGGGIGLILIASMFGGLSFIIVALLIVIVGFLVASFYSDYEEATGNWLIVLSIIGVGIVGKMLHLNIFEETLPLVSMKLLPSLLLLVATLTIAGVWGAIADSAVFGYMKGENENRTENYSNSLMDNGVTMWLLGMGAALFICITLAMGSAVAVKTNDDITGWIGDRLPDKIANIKPDVAFTAVGVDVSFSLADMTHGLVAGWVAVLAALVIIVISILIFAVPISISEQALNKDVEKRQRSLAGPLAAVLYIAACLILLIVPPLFV